MKRIFLACGTSKIAALLLVAILLAGCNLPTRGTPTATLPGDAVATQISLLVTASAIAPSETPVPTVPPPAEMPTSEPTPTQTATALTPTAAASPTMAPSASPGGPRAGLGSPSWEDNLDTSNFFYLYDTESTRVTHENGHLALTGRTTEGWHGWSLSFSNEPTNFYLEAAFIPQDCAGADLYGLVFRAPDESSGYFFGVTCDGRYSLHERNFDDGTDIILVEATQNSAILTSSGATNRLGVMARGETIGLYANDTLLEEVTDATYASGHFGPFVAADQTPGFTVWMDTIALWNLP